MAPCAQLHTKLDERDCLTAGGTDPSSLHCPREAALRVRSHISPGPYRSFRELSLAGPVGPDIWCPPTFVGNSGIERFNGICGFALIFGRSLSSRCGGSIRCQCCPAYAGAFRRSPKRFQAKWTPVRVKKTRQKETRAPFRFNRNGNGSGRQIASVEHSLVRESRATAAEDGHARNSVEG